MGASKPVVQEAVGGLAGADVERLAPLLDGGAEVLGDGEDGGAAAGADEGNVVLAAAVAGGLFPGGVEGL
jgi:hypothetical protein